ncbi:MAG TPA: TylF/MycF/NovP-related O-methyltransferase, partial [Terriglobales bacterium]
KVAASFTSFGLPPEKNSVQLIQGLYEDTLTDSSPVAFAHIDCDWYRSVMVCLERLMPRLSAGGSVIIDDYFVYSGCRTAVWDYFRQRQDEYQFVYGPRLKVYRPPPLLLNDNHGICHYFRAEKVRRTIIPGLSKLAGG